MKKQTISYVIKTDDKDRLAISDKKEALAKWNHLRATEIRNPQTLDFTTHRLFRRVDTLIWQ